VQKTLLPLVAFRLSYFPKEKMLAENSPPTGLASFSWLFDRKCLPGPEATFSRLAYCLNSWPLGTFGLDTAACLAPITGNLKQLPQLFSTLRKRHCPEAAPTPICLVVFQLTFVHFLLTPLGGENR